ncbi:hypothetical protein D3C78_1902000 [compost metagenome]
MQKDAYLSRTQDKRVRAGYEQYPDDAIVEWIHYDPAQSDTISFRLCDMRDIQFDIILRA